MIDISRPAALPDGSCMFAAVEMLRPEDFPIRPMRQAFAPRLAVIATIDRIIVVARFSGPVPPRTAVGMATTLAGMITLQWPSLRATATAPCDVLKPIHTTKMDEYRLALSSVGPRDIPVAPVLRDVFIQRDGGGPMLITADAPQGGAA